MAVSQEQGEKKPHGLPVRFFNLSVPAPGGARGADILVQNLGGVLSDIITLRSMRQRITKAMGLGRSERELMLVSGVEGVVEQGELLLVIGPPKSNPSTLLRALSSSTDFPLSSDSQLDYGGQPPSSLSRSFPLFSKLSQPSLRSEVVYSESDAHFAALSLHASLYPPALAKTPIQAPSDLTKAAWAESRLDQVLESVGLSHAKNTPVGSTLVHGLSGGERKRASIAEAILTRASILLLDGPTNGLDSSTAFSLLSFLHDWTKKGMKSLIVTSPHISDPLYEKFDKVLVLSSSSTQLYFGPTKDAQAYFENLGLGFSRRHVAGEGVAEFIINCVESSVNNRDLERSWLKSTARTNLLKDMKKYESQYSYETCAKPLLDYLATEKSPLTPKTSHYTVSFLSQVRILTRRQYALVYAELPTYITKTTVNILLSILVGTLFFQLPPTTSGGALPRASVLFLSIMFNGYLSLAELGKTIEGRDIVRRQGDYGFFGSSALALARVAGDLPLIGGQVLLFGTITYLLAGLQRTFHQFAIYILFTYATALNLSALFRMFAAFSPTFDEAIRYCGVMLNVLVIYAGFFIPTPSMRPWLKWIHVVIDPISYSYEAVLTNEFHNLSLACSSSDTVPYGPSYNDTRYQTCSMPGSSPRSLQVSGDAFLSLSYDFHHSNIWRNLGIILVQATVFFVIAVVATDSLHFAPEGRKRVWNGTKAAKKMLRKRWFKRAGEGEAEEFLSTDELDEEGGVDDDEDAGVDGKGSTLMWQHLSLWVDTPTETKRLLDRISGCIKPGETCALIGASGAGKSTLLNVLAGRMSGVVKGRIVVDGQQPKSQFYRTTGYVEQFDLHDEQSTVREALEFSALLRQDALLPRAEKLAYVDVVLDFLDLRHLADAIVGTTQAGLDAEMRKRLTIALEVVSRPAILFCDEPTTGLNTKSALRIVRLLKKLARTGLPVISSIHQPTSETFSEFDNVLLLQRGGKQIYFGPRADALRFFSVAANSETTSNPAELLLDAAESGFDGEAGRPDHGLPGRWASSDASKKLQADLNTLAETSTSTRPPSTPVTIFRQCIEVTKRVSRNYYRDASYSYTKLFTATVVPTIVGLSFLQLESSIVGMQNRLFSIFLILFIPPVVMNLKIFKMLKLRGIWEARERPSKIFGRTAFCTSLLVSEIPYSVICAAIYFCIWYFLVGFPMNLHTILFTFTMVQMFFLFMSTWAMWITALAPSAGMIANLLPFFLVSMEAFNGSLMPYAHMPTYWRWLYWVSPFQWYIKAVLGVVVHDLPVRCSAAEVVTFEAPPSLSCAAYAAEYLASHAGYLTNSTSQSIGNTCGFCKLSTGDDYLSLLHISYSDRWLAFGIFLAYLVTNIFLVYALTFMPPERIVQWVRRKRGRQSRVEGVAERDWLKEVEEADRLIVERNLDAFT